MLLEGFSCGIPSGKLGWVEVGFGDPRSEGGRLGASQEDSRLIHVFLGIRRVQQRWSLPFPLVLGILQSGKCCGNSPVWEMLQEFSSF